MASHIKLERLIRKKKTLQERRRKQEEQLRETLKAISNEQRDLNKQIEEEQYAVLIKLLRQTGLPLDNTAIIVGLALEAKDILSGTDEIAKTAAINKYTQRYIEFTAEQNQQEKSDMEPEPLTQPAAAPEKADPTADTDSPTLYYAEGMG